MTLRRKLIIAFWIFIACMLLWQCYDYNRTLEEQGAEHPQQRQFIFFNTNTAPGKPSPPHYQGAHVEQVSYRVQNDTPGPGSFTSVVTVKNVGDATATDIQVSVHPFRGAQMGDEDNGHVQNATLSDNDPLTQIVQWVPFPDLAPGQSGTESVVFTSRPRVPPGPNSHPEISYGSDKNAPGANTSNNPAPETTTPNNPPATPPTIPAHRPAE